MTKKHSEADQKKIIDKDDLDEQTMSHFHSASLNSILTWIDFANAQNQSEKHVINIQSKTYSKIEKKNMKQLSQDQNYIYAHAHTTILK